MLDYIIKVLLFQTLFLVVYDLFLKRETFFQWNRVYLMATSVLAYVIPSIKISRVQEMIPQEYVVLLPDVMLNPTVVIENKFDWWTVFYSGLTILFWMGVAFASVLFALRLYKIIKLIYTHKKVQKPNYFLVLLENSKAFSFFNYIFLGNHISDTHKEQIIEHELVHVQQIHSLDLLLFEFQKIVCWFNPYSYLYQARMSELHEFIADSKTIKTENKITYFNNLLAETFGIQNISFINPFFKHSLLKKRILMLNKNKSKQNLKLKYVLLIPVLAGMLIYSSCEKSETELAKDVPFAQIEKAPIFPDCENAEDPKKCLQESIQKHVAIKFNTGLAKTLGLEPGKKKVYVVFKIDKEGNITDVKARGPHQDLEAEAIRVVNSLPKMIPGEHQGKKVGVKYTLPITLMVSDQSNNIGTQQAPLKKLKNIKSNVYSNFDDTLKDGFVAGKVSNGDLMLPGVNVIVKGTNRAVQTDFIGNFRIEAKKGDILILDFKGLPTAEFKVTENNNYKVTM